MEPYIFKIKEKFYSVSVQVDKTYLIQSEGIIEFTISPNLIEEEIIWKVEKGMADQDLVFILGQAIEGFENRKTTSLS
jgi:hypothetical protein